MVTTPAPCVALSLTEQEVHAVRLSWEGDRPAIVDYSSATLSKNMLTPSVNSPNIADPIAISDVVKDLMDDVSGPYKRIALVIPDVVAKVSLIKFDEVPGRSSDLEQMLGWKIASGLPFSIDDGQMAYAHGISVEGGQEYIVSIMKRVIVREYEEVLLEAGITPGLIDLDTFNVINSVFKVSPEKARGDCLLIQIADKFCTLVVAREGYLIFFRNQPIESVDELLKLVHQSSMYYRDRLSGAEFDTILLNIESSERWSNSQKAKLRVLLETRFQTPIISVGEILRRGISDKTDSCAGNFDSLAAPLGILLRD